MQLWDHQRTAVEKSMDRDNLALFFDAGTGKSATTINIILKIWGAQRKPAPVLIFCPPVVIENWRREWMRFAGLSPEFVVPLVGPQKKRIELVKNPGQAKIFILVMLLFAKFSDTPPKKSRNLLHQNFTLKMTLLLSVHK